LPGRSEPRRNSNLPHLSNFISTTGPVEGSVRGLAVARIFPAVGRAEKQMANFFRIRNFERFQHYKDRNPPWIRLYVASGAIAPSFAYPTRSRPILWACSRWRRVWTTASRMTPNGSLTNCALRNLSTLGPLLASGFLVPEHPASGAEAEGKPPDTCSVSESDLLCTKARCETILDGTNGDGADSESRPAPSDSEVAGVETAMGEPLRERRRGKGPEVKWPAALALDDQMRRFAVALGIDPDAEFEPWRDDCAAHDRRYADWRAAWRGRCRNALRFGGRGGARTRASPAEGAMEVALRRLREASERERSGSVS
jgi:hypothetical protein